MLNFGEFRPISEKRGILLTSSYGVNYCRDVILRHLFGLIKYQFSGNRESAVNYCMAIC
jgi:hypothetical protein